MVCHLAQCLLLHQDCYHRSPSLILVEDEDLQAEVPWLILGSLLYACRHFTVHVKISGHFMEKASLDLFFPNVTTHIKVTPTSQSAFLLAEFALQIFIFLISSLLLIFPWGTHLAGEKHMDRPQKLSHTCIHQGLSLHPVLPGPLSLPLPDRCFDLFQIFKLRSFLFLFCTFMVGSYHTPSTLLL